MCSRAEERCGAGLSGLILLLPATPRRSENIAQAMAVRGFQGPADHRLYMMNVNQTSVVANCLALGLLLGFIGLIRVFN